MSFMRKWQPGQETGFTLVELLVVILIIGILAAIAIPAFLSQKSKASDAAAKVQARTAETAAETYSTDHNGSYVNMTTAALQEIEPALKDTSAAVMAVSGTPSSSSYKVESVSSSTGDKFWIERTSSDEILRTCEPASNSNHGGCPNGEAGKAGSW